MRQVKSTSSLSDQLENIAELAWVISADGNQRDWHHSYKAIDLLTVRAGRAGHWLSQATLKAGIREWQARALRRNAGGHLKWLHQRCQYHDLLVPRDRAKHLA